MATLDTTRNYADGEVLTKADLDAPLDDIEAFMNVTRINDDNIQNNGITGSTKLLNQSVSEAKLAANSVTTLKIADQNVTTGKIADNAVTTAKLGPDAVTNAKIADDAVDTENIADAAVETDQLADDSVTAAKLKDSASTDSDRAVTTDHIRDSAITTAKINTSAVTRAKLGTNYIQANVNQTVSTAGSTATVSLGTLTTYGRPLRILVYSGTMNMTSGNSANPCYLRDTTSNTNLIQMWNMAVTGSVTFGDVSNSIPNRTNVQEWFLPSLAAGTYTLALHWTAANTQSTTFTNVKFHIEEI